MSASGDEISFRPHHFMCTLAFEGKGYSPDFVTNYDKIHKQLIDNPDTDIKITHGLDAVCEACPHQRQNNLCDKQALIEHLDHGYHEALKLKDTSSLSWREAKNRIKQNITVDKFNGICKLCAWHRYGMCEKALKKLLDE